MRDIHRLLSAAVIATLILPAALAAPAPLDDPVVNGEFELFVPDDAAEQLEGTPADECVGIGHQVLYGSETWQQRVEDGATSATDGETGNATENATRAVDAWTSAPLDEARFLSGYGHCVYSSEEGYDVVWLNPVRTAQDDAVHWSRGDDNTAFGSAHDGDPIDREVRIGANASASGHNLWQAWPSPHQAYTASFDALTFRVESGEIPSSAAVKISLSATPAEEVTPWALLFLDCDITFTADQLRSSMVEGTVRADPVDAVLRSRHETCQDAKQAWDDADAAKRREILGRLRMVQLSFWGFNKGETDVVLDGVALEGTSTAAEEVAQGNTDNFLSSEPRSRDNGVVTMIHGRFSPNPTGPTPLPPGHEAFAARAEGGKVVLHVIPYSVETEAPLNLSGASPRLLVDVPGVGDMFVAPKADPADHPRCEDETTLPGHEGPLEACLVFEIDADRFEGRNAPTLELHWDGGLEAYSSASHLMIHESMEGGLVTFEQADDRSGQPTPFVVEHGAAPAP